MREDESEEVIYACRISYYAIYFIILSITVITIGWLAGDKWLSKLFGLFVTSIFFIGFLLVLPLLFILESSKKIVISTQRIKFFNIFRKIECRWNDILKIEKVIQRVNSTRGELVYSWIYYNIITSKGTFSLDCGIWGEDIFKKLYGIIISRNPNVSLLEREEEVEEAPLPVT